MTLPQFRADAGLALDTAARAEAAGLDGVFVFDHLWPIGRPDRPALHALTLAAALLAETRTVAVGTLVARVGVVPDAVLVHALATLARMAGPRLIAGLGVGDHLSRAENLAYGVAFRSRPERLASLVEVCRRLRARGITTWVGGTSPALRALARAEADALNLWGVAPDELPALAEVLGLSGPAGAARTAPVTWAGQVDLSPASAGAGAAGLRALLGAVAGAGAEWAVVAPLGVAWPEAVESVAAAAGALVD